MMKIKTDEEIAAAQRAAHKLFPPPGNHTIIEHPPQPTVGSGPAVKPHSLQIEEHQTQIAELTKRVGALESQVKTLKKLTKGK